MGRPKYLAPPTNYTATDADADYVLKMLAAAAQELGETFKTMPHTARLAWLKDWQQRNPPPEK